MSRSLVRLVVTTLVSVAAAIVVLLFTYVQTAEWTEDDMRRVGLFWVYRTVDEAAPVARADRLASVQPDIPVPIEMTTSADLETRLGRSLGPGERTTVEVGRREHWLYMAFSDGTGGLVIGPVDPVNPYDRFPVGLLVAILVGPLIAGAMAIRISRQLKKVERASQALGAGELSARVDNPSGPSSELAASFNDMAERVERLVRERDELLQAVSHELGSPLARLRFQLELLTGDVREDAPTGERLDAMAHQVDELDQLVEDLLRWVQSDESAMRCETFDAVAPLAHLAELAELDAGSDTEVSVEVDAPAEVTLVADPRQYQRAVGNLLRNAVRYAAQKVRLHVDDDDQNVVVRVEDDGPGIPVEDRERVLEPFTRLGADRDRRAGGAGLGLAIVQRIVSSHGGRVAIGESAMGGAEVTLTWPKQKSTPVSRTA